MRVRSIPRRIPPFVDAARHLPPSGTSRAQGGLPSLDLAAGDARPGTTDGLTLVVIRLLVDHQCRSVLVQDLGPDRAIKACQCREELCVDRPCAIGIDIGEIPSIRALGVEQAVLLPLRIEMPPGGLKALGRIAAVPAFVDMHTMVALPSRELFKLKPDHDPRRPLPECCGAERLPVGAKNLRLSHGPVLISTSSSSDGAQGQPGHQLPRYTSHSTLRSRSGDPPLSLDLRPIAQMAPRQLIQSRDPHEFHIPHHFVVEVLKGFLHSGLPSGGQCVEVKVPP